MIRVHYVPSRSGDVRFEATADGRTRITVRNPTSEETSLLGRYLALAVTRGWCTPERANLRKDYAADAEIDVPLDVPLDEASRLFLGSRAPAKGVILGVRYADGTIQATLDGPAEGEDLLGPIPPAAAVDPVTAPDPTKKGIDPVSAAPAPEPKAPVAAVTTPRPTLCCPNPRQGPIDRASEVLHAFVTPDQWDEWTRDGMIHCKGNLTGDTYRVVHRKHPLAERQGKITWCETTDHVVHCHQTHLPPPEEVLAVLLTLQFGEDYVRNPSGYFGHGVRFPHPLGRGSWDGVASAALVSGIGDAFASSPYRGAYGWPV